MRHLPLLLAFTAAMPATAVASDCNKAEYHRLSSEAEKLAQRNAWAGVERAYEAMIATGCELDFDDHHTGAQSARTLGKIWETYQRLSAATALDARPEIAEMLAGFDQQYGRVRIKGDARRRPELHREAMPFAPDQRKAIEWAQQVLAGTGSFEGMLPLGDYEVGGNPFTVSAGGEWQLVEVGRVKGTAAVQKQGAVHWAGLVATVGPGQQISPEPGSPVVSDRGLHQFAPHDISATGISMAVGGEVGLTYRAPEAGVAATLGYSGGYGNDTLHGFNAWLAAVVRPGEARIAFGPSYALMTGRGTGVASWFDVGHDPDRTPNDTLRYQGWSWGGGLQGSVGYGLLDLGAMKGLVELHGAWHTDGARTFTTAGLRLGVVPRVPRFRG